MSIGEYARAVELSVSAVRFYADRGLLAPAATDPTSGYRYYDESQIGRGVLIRDLRLMDMALSEIEAALAMTASERERAIQDYLRGLESKLAAVHRVAQSLGTSANTTTTSATTVRPEDLAVAIGQVLPAAGYDPRRPHHMSVLVALRDHSLRLAATDSHRLAVRDLVPLAPGPEFSVVVAAEEIRSWPGLMEPGDELAVEVTAESLRVYRRDLHLSCRTIPVVFPDYEPILARSGLVSTTVIVNRRKVLSALEAFDEGAVVSVAAQGSELVASCGAIVRRVEAEVTGTAAQVSVNQRFIAQAITHAVGAELVIEIADTRLPVTIRSADDGTYTSLLMPII